MKTLFLSLCLILGLTQAARAMDDQNLDGPAACDLTFDAKGGGLQLLVGEFVVRGPGKISCRDLQGNEESMNVEVQLGGKSPVALKLAVGYLHVLGAASGIGFARAPRDLLGSYLDAGADAAVVVGAGADASFHLKNNAAATLNLSLQAEAGFGFDVGFNSLTISELP